MRVAPSPQSPGRTTVGASDILPLEGLALLFAVDNFLSMARALANVIGNGVATIVVAKLENEFSAERGAEAGPQIV